MVLTEATARLVGQMLDVVLEHGYEIEGDMELFDPERFLANVLEMVEVDDDFDAETASALRESVAYLQGLTEGAAELIGKGSNQRNVGPGKRRDAKKAVTRKVRRISKMLAREKEDIPAKTQGWAS